MKSVFGHMALDWHCWLDHCPGHLCAFFNAVGRKHVRCAAQACALKELNPELGTLSYDACSTPTRPYWSSWTRSAKRMIRVAQRV